MKGTAISDSEVSAEHPQAVTSLEPSVRSRLRTGLVWNLLATVSNQGSTLLTNILIAHLLGRQMFGQYAMVQTTILSLTGAAAFALPYTVTRYVSEFRARDAQRAGELLGLTSRMLTGISGSVAVILFVGAPWIASHLLHQPSLRLCLMLAAGSLFFFVRNLYLMAVLAGLENYRASAIGALVSGIGYVFFIYYGAWRWGLNGAFAGLLVSFVLQSAILWLCTQTACRLQNIRFQYRGMAQFGREKEILARFTLPAAMNGGLILLAQWLPSTFLTRRPDGYGQLAVYSAAFTLMMLVSFLPNILNNVGMSLLNNQKGAGNYTNYIKVYRANIGLAVGMVVGMAGLVALFGPSILHIYGRSFGEGYPALMVLLLAAIVDALTMALWQPLQDKETMWSVFRAVNLPRDISIVALSYFLSVRYGAVGIASAYLMGRLVALIAVLILIQKTRPFARIAAMQDEASKAIS